MKPMKSTNNVLNRRFTKLLPDIIGVNHGIKSQRENWSS